MITDPKLEELYGIKFEEPKFSKTAINAVKTSCKIKNDVIINIEHAFSNSERRSYVNEGRDMIRGIMIFAKMTFKKEEKEILQWEFHKHIKAIEEKYYEYYKNP